MEDQTQSFTADLLDKNRDRDRDAIASAKKRSRVRPMVSCLECRKKKLRCDRLQPCSACIKGRRTESCVFSSVAPPRELPKYRANNGDSVNSISGDTLEKMKRSSSLDGEFTLREGRTDGHQEGIDAGGTYPPREAYAGKVVLKCSQSWFQSTGDRMTMLDHVST